MQTGASQIKASDTVFKIGDAFQKNGGNGHLAGGNGFVTGASVGIEGSPNLYTGASVYVTSGASKEFRSGGVQIQTKGGHHSGILALKSGKAGGTRQHRKLQEPDQVTVYARYGLR